MSDFDNYVGVIVLNGVYDLFFFDEQPILPNTWQNICYTSFNSLTRVFLNGVMLFEDKLPPLSEEIPITKAYIGANPSVKVGSLQNICFPL